MSAARVTIEADEARYGSSIAHLYDELARIDLLVRGQVARAREANGDDGWRGLTISEAEVDSLLRRTLGSPPWDLAQGGPSLDDAHALADAIAQSIARRCAATKARLRLAELAETFGLDRFDVDVVLIALAPEVDLRYERLYAYLHDDVTRKRPSVDLALHLLCRSFEERISGRALFGADAPLIRKGVIHVIADAAAAPPLVAHTIKVDDRIVHWLLGSDAIDARLAPHARRISPTVSLESLVMDDALRDQLRRIALEAAAGAATPIVYLHGPAGVGKRSTAEALARIASNDLLVLDASSFEGLADDAVRGTLRCLSREARLTGDVLLCENADAILGGDRRLARAALLDAVAEIDALVVLAGEAPWDPTGASRARAFVRVELRPPDACAQEILWRDAFAGVARAAEVDFATFTTGRRLTAGEIHDVVATASGLARLRSADAAITTVDIHESRRRLSTRRFGSFARKVSARPSWDDLILSGDRVERLRELCDHARHRALVLDRWGFGPKLPNGKGLGLLFTGAPGTGKTLAASVIATELGLDLYQIDLASVVSKWVGETEKHLARIFDEAERGHGILFFDEADALFGKRGELHDAHDRYANLETSYLLQRMEEFEGIVILASNFRRNMDEAFVRRLRFIIEFPLPDERERIRIWERIWPADTPRSADIDLAYMARKFDVAGAYIRNMALAAAFLAAAEGTSIEQRHLLRAAKREYQKMGKMVDDSLFATANVTRSS